MRKPLCSRACHATLASFLSIMCHSAASPVLCCSKRRALSFNLVVLWLVFHHTAAGTGPGQTAHARFPVRRPLVQA